MERLEQGTERDGEGYLELTVIWEGALDEEQLFRLDGGPLDPEDRRTLAVWFADVKRDARDADADVDVYVLEHGHALADGEECTCAQYLTDGHPYWSSREER